MRDWPTNYWELGALLLHQQCWHFGRDIISPHGNLLLASGFSRTRPPEGLPASSRYTRHLPGQPALCLWAFGLLAYRPGEGGIYINRYNFVPRWVPDPDTAATLWKPGPFDACVPAITHRTIRLTRQLLRSVLLTFAGYEDDILSTQGIAYRRDSLRNWHLPAILPGRLPREWRELSWHIPEPPVPSRDHYHKECQSPDLNIHSAKQPVFNRLVANGYCD